MEDLEMMEVNVSDIAIEQPSPDIDIQTSDINYNKAMQANNYAEVSTNDGFSYEDQPKTTSSVVPLCITVVLCLIVGIALGIFSAKRTASK